MLSLKPTTKINRNPIEEKNIMNIRVVAAGSILLSGWLISANAIANCDPGEMVIKFSHVTNTDKHPKGIAASLLQKRVNEEMNGIACM